MTSMKIGSSRPTLANRGLPRVVSSAAPIMKGARASASSSNSVTPSSTRNSSTPASAAATGRTTTASSVNPRGLGVIAPKLTRMVTTPSDAAAAGQPASTKTTDDKPIQNAARTGISGGALAAIVGGSP